MTTFYKPLFLVVFCLWGTISLQAQNKSSIYLGKVPNVVAAYKANLTKTNAATSTSNTNKISYIIPGQAPLVLTVKNNKKEGAHEVFSGPVNNGKNNYFFLKAEGAKLSGYVILKDQKKAYEYASVSNQVYLKEVNIDKVLCLEYEPAKSKAAPAISSTTNLVGAVPDLQSLPGAKAVIYLDFDGEKVKSLYWNAGNVIDAKPADLSESEIVDVWKLISEDFRPFAVNITTSLTAYRNAPANRRMRVIFTPTDDAGPGYGGIAYVGSYTWGNDTPCWVFNSGIKGAGEAGSHEAGHTLGLSHDGRTSPLEEYYAGQGSWAPIMGVGYYVEQVQWSRGEYSKASNTENDLTIITSKDNGIGFRPDDYSNNSTNARPLVANSSGVILAANNKGIITTQADIDVFSFTVGSGAITLNVNPSPDYPNLDILSTLKNSAGTTVASAESDNMSASLTPTLTPGTYYLYVTGVRGKLGANSDYGSMGEYSISGNLLSSYCTPLVTKGCRDGDYIDSFKFNTLTNSSSGCNGQSNGYIIYPATGSLTTTVNPGQSYTLSLKSGADYPEGFGVWIDYNNNNNFSDAGEFVYQSPTAVVGETYTGKITIPTKITPGPRRMRVRAQYNTVIEAEQFCDAFEFGETEDYTITIGQPVAQSGWDVAYGGSETESFSEVIKTTDGGYLLGGYSASGQTGDKTQDSRGANDYWIVKTDANGKKVWDKRFGGNGHDYLNRLIQTHDGGFLLAGSSLSGIGGDKSQASRGDRDYWIVKIASDGVKQWDKRFGGSGYDELRKVAQLPSGDYMLAGTSDSPAGGDKSQGSQGGRDYWLVKLNNDGTKIWDKRYGGNLADNLENFLLTNDGGFLLGGASTSGQTGNKSQSSQGGEDFWLVRTDANGNQLWDQRFGGSRDDHLFSMGRLSTGEFFVAGCSSSGKEGDKSQASQGAKDFWMLKISSSGAKIWDKRFGGSNDDELRSIIRTADGGFLLAGKSASGVSGDKSQDSQGGADYWIVKLASNGSKQWDRRLGGRGAEELRNVLIAADGSYVLGGRSESGLTGDRTQNNLGGSDYWLIKIEDTSVAGSLAVANNQVTAATRLATPLEANNQLINLTAYPNPFADKMTLSFTLAKTQTVHVQIYNGQGQVVKTLYRGELQAAKHNRFTWQPSQPLKAGIYFVRVATSTKSFQQKVLLQQ
ncbi:GEVED domain-containing protein [Adhaeribacter radiodurans]|uniref:T9SS type A sorting domain-containing protein n=1 Tax=Adhaeribacter radiodurans TaxID=2745197 RepID=A0A7L7L2C6_9BACT|nr:GEVED domain-containing protein [Adhaeribacter radiodurans]QMU26745.1 T9SS type A sorting domain-containing protein [Adhaeribacter radiodurans]